jgi:uncharacterized membrane protein YeaQ/YmgE (transglycosylase-associated protein family)
MEFIEWLVTSPFICIGWIIVGAIAGGLARSIMGSRDYPLISDVILGIAGAIVGGFIAGFLGIPSERDSGLTLVLINLVIATLGAAVLIAIRRAVTRSA